MKDDFHKQISVDVGAAIREQRLAAGLSQDQLAEALDVGPEAVSRMERGVVYPTIPKLAELANVLKCPIETFIPLANGSTQSSANEINKMMENLDKKDAQFVTGLIDQVCNYLVKR